MFEVSFHHINYLFDKQKYKIFFLPLHKLEIIRHKRNMITHFYLADLVVLSTKQRPGHKTEPFEYCRFSLPIWQELPSRES